MIVEYAGKKFTSYGKPAILEFQNGGLRLCEIVVLRNQLREIARNYAELCALYDEYAVAMHGVAARLFLCFRLEQVDWFAFDALQCDFFLAARQIEIEGCVGGLAHGVQYVGIGRIGDICGIFHDILAHEFRKIGDVEIAADEVCFAGTVRIAGDCGGAAEFPFVGFFTFVGG